MNLARKNSNTFFMIQMDLDLSMPIQKLYKEQINNKLDLSISGIKLDSCMIYERNKKK